MFVLHLLERLVLEMGFQELQKKSYKWGAMCLGFLDPPKWGVLGSQGGGLIFVTIFFFNAYVL